MCNHLSFHHVKSKSTFKGFAPKDAAWKTELFAYIISKKPKKFHKDAFQVKTGQFCPKLGQSYKKNWPKKL